MLKQPHRAEAERLSLAKSAACQATAQVMERSTTLRLLSMLQTTLDAERLIGLLDRELRPAFGYDGLCYEHASLDIRISIGSENVRYRNSYRLWLDTEDLGELTIHRRQKLGGRRGPSAGGASLDPAFSAAQLPQSPQGADSGSLRRPHGIAQSGGVGGGPGAGTGAMSPAR